MRHIAIAGVFGVAAVALWWLVVGSGAFRPGAPEAVSEQVTASRAEGPASSQPPPAATRPAAVRERAAPRPFAERHPGADPHPDLPGFESDPRSAVDPQVLAEAKSRAASYALSKGLVDPALLAQKARQAVPEGSVPSALLDTARQDYQQTQLENAAIVDFLAARDIPPDASGPEHNRITGWLETLVRSMNESDRNHLLPQVAAGAPPPPDQPSTSGAGRSSGSGSGGL